jgi:uncharacterized protein
MKMTIDFVLDENQDFKDSILITGFHGIGTTGFIAIKYIISQLEAKKIGTIITDFIPPFITTKNGNISLPFELYKKERIVLLMPQFQPYRNEHRIFSEKVVDWSIKSKFKEIILIGGLDSRLKKNDTDKIRIVKTSKIGDNEKIDLPILEDGLFVTGPLALMLTYCEIKKVPAIALLPYAESSRADPLAAANAIESINYLLKTNIDTKKLIQDAEVIEKNLQEVISQTKEQNVEEKEHGAKRLYI